MPPQDQATPKWLIGCAAAVAVVFVLGAVAVVAVGRLTEGFFDDMSGGEKEEAAALLDSIEEKELLPSEHAGLLADLRAYVAQDRAGYFGLLSLSTVVRQVSSDDAINENELETLAALRDYLKENPAPNAIEMSGLLQRLGVENVEVSVSNKPQ